MKLFFESGGKNKRHAYLGTPLPGYTALEIKNRKMVTEILLEFNRKHNSKRVLLKEEDSLEILNILRKVLEEKLGGKLNERHEIIRFYEECSNTLPDIAEFICEQLSPDQRDQIEAWKNNSGSVKPPPDQAA